MSKRKEKRRVKVALEFDTTLSNDELYKALAADRVILSTQATSDVEVQPVREPLAKDELLVLVGRHGESWPRFITKHVGLAARWEAHDSPYRSIVRMSMDDDRLTKVVEKEEEERGNG